MRSHPEPEQREPVVTTSVETCSTADPEIRSQLLKLLETGISQTDIARGARVNRSIVSQYCSPEGNKYPGDIAKYEPQFAAWLARRGLETLAGISTVETAVTRQIAIAARMLRKCRIIGKGIGDAGLGKTRGAAWLAASDPGGVIVISVTQETGKREGIRRKLMKALGIQGPSKRVSGGRAAAMYAELVKRLTDADILILIDQAHRLSKSAMDFLTELWNDAHSPQFWLGTEELIEKVERDEQVASRVEFTAVLSHVDPKGELKPRDLVKHQIQSRLPSLNGELPQLLGLCEKLALNGSYRRVEMRLDTMLFLRESDQQKTWPELFELAGDFLTLSATE